MTTATVAMSGTQNLDALLSGVRWGDGRISFGFPSTGSSYGPYAWNLDHDNNPNTPAISVNETVGFSALNATQQQAARDAFHQVSLITNYTTAEWTPAENGDVRLAMSSTRSPGNTTAYAAYPDDTGTAGTEPQDGDAWFNPTDYNTPRLGTYAYQTFFHEIGHAIGLKHGHEADNGNTNVLSSDRDSLEFSTMTYRAYVGHPGSGGYGVADGHYPQSYMMWDIQALQHMYGPSYRTYAGDNTYRFDPVNGQMTTDIEGFGVPMDSADNPVNVLFRTVWDGGGIDTYDFSGYGSNRQMRIDLAPGSWTDVDADSDYQAADLNNPDGSFARGQVFNALLFNNDTRSLIENAIGGAGDDWIKGNQANNRLEGRAGNDTLEGFDGHDTLDQGGGGGGLYGGNGNDYMIAGDGGEVVDGGNDFDTVDYSRSTSEIQIDTTIGKVLGGNAWNDTLVSIESIVGTAYDDQIRMGAGNNQLWGGGGNDVLAGGAGADYMDGGAGHDSAKFDSAVNLNFATGVHSGEAAGDGFGSIERYVGSEQVDTMVAHPSIAVEFAGGDGNDTLVGSNLNDWLQGGRGEDVLSGGGGVDIVSYADAPNAIIAELYMKDATHDGKITAGEWGYDTLIDIEGVEGSSFADTLLGDSDANRLIGGGGDDRIEGREGADTLEGGIGNDSMDGGTGGDTLYGGAGNDLLDGGTGNNVLRGEGGDDVFVVGAGVDVLDGGEGRDTMLFTRATIADWQAGVLDADVGFDSWLAWEAIQGSVGADRIRTNSWGFDIELRGGGGNDVLACGNGNDTLRGEAGADWITGGLGIDLLAGGDGDDHFSDSGAGLNGDQLIDFAVGDCIDVRGTSFSALTYDAASGLLALDSMGDGSYATQLALAPSLVGEFMSFLRSDAGGSYTEVRLMADSDGDGIGDFRDNAIDLPNADQRDTDGDGYGNVGDADLNQDLIIDLLDLSLLEAVFGGDDANADFNGDGAVDLVDLSILDGLFGGPPGRSYIDAPAIAAQPTLVDEPTMQVALPTHDDHFALTPDTLLA